MLSGFALGTFKPPVELSTSVGLSPTVPERCLLYLLDRVGAREDEPGAQELTCSVRSGAVREVL